MNIVMGWPEWIVVFFLVVSVWSRAVSITKLKTETEKAGAGVGLIFYIILWPSLLYWGGFF